MPGPTPHYPLEFKREAVGLYRASEKSIPNIAKELGIGGLVHHSDRGVQYTAPSFSERLREVGTSPSMGRTGTALDNPMVESFVSTLKAELVSTVEFPSRRAAKTAIFE